MLRGLYTSAAGMISQQRKHDTITNNISNLNTPGFKQGNAVSRSFPEMLISLVGKDEGQTEVRQIGRLNTGVFAEEDLSIYVQGDLSETKNPLDMAIISNIQVPGLAFDGAGKAMTPDGQKVFQPQAFFTVLDNEGQERYSRNGKFAVNDTGELVSSEGYRVLGADGQPIVLRDNATGEFISSAKVTPTGQFVDAVNGVPLLDAQGNQIALRISRVDNPNRLVREGNGVYRINAGDEGLVTVAVPNNEVQIRQGFIERSNVDAAQSMVDMNAALRAYETNQKMVQYYDKSLEKAVNEVGRV
ncbi:flagellar hook-basal body protein [Paenibacillus cymbidii]|uniref:flagellar hook-basal body protein n=1 Tax=Paenibacillus cymbidii TaxID=1639034 RepID=UPI001080249A|nr:flagellar hook-basal body protein [Paenibacillus cymbidii]